MINIAILDDEKNYLEYLINNVQLFAANSDYDINVTGFNDSKNLLNCVNEYDIFLLDIEMDNINGIELVKSLNKIYIKNKKPIVIFVTNYDNYVYQSFELEIFRFLPKSKTDILLEEYIKQAIERYFSLMPKYYSIMNKNTSVRLPFESIVYIEKHGKNILFHTKDYAVYSERNTLKNVICCLDNSFIFIDRCYIVNISEIFSIDNRVAILKDKTRLSISKLRLNDVKRLISEYWRKN